MQYPQEALSALALTWDKSHTAEIQEEVLETLSNKEAKQKLPEEITAHDACSSAPLTGPCFFSGALVTS